MLTIFALVLTLLFAVFCTTVVAADGGGVGAAASDLDGVAGKVFDLSLEDGGFRFLRQDVQIDPATGVGRAWYHASITERTTFLEREGRKNFFGIEGPVVAIFSGLDEMAMALREQGEMFRAEQVVLRPDLRALPELPGSAALGGEGDGEGNGGQRLVGWFTPRQAKFSRDGVIRIAGELGDKEIAIGVKRGGVRIAIEQARVAKDLLRGSWCATLTGDVIDGRFVVDHMLLDRLPDQKDVDPALPRVLSVGDSISMNYEEATREHLAGVANYHRIEDNCWSTRRGMAFIAYWLGDYTKPGRGWDVIHFNSGLHDMKQKELGGAYAVPLKEYKRNLRHEIEIMKKTGATLVFCTTTPVQNDSGSARYAFRSQGAEDEFNRAAREVLADYPEILINDLAGYIDGSPEFDDWRKGKDVHFWKQEEQALLGEAVASAIKKSLAARKARQAQQSQQQ